MYFVLMISYTYSVLPTVGPVIRPNPEVSAVQHAFEGGPVKGPLTETFLPRPSTKHCDEVLRTRPNTV